MAGEIFQRLDAKRSEWAALSKHQKKAFLVEVLERCADWGFLHDWAKAECICRGILDVEEGSGEIGFQSLVLSTMLKKPISVLVRALDENLQIRKVDLKRQFHIETSATAFLTDEDPILKTKTILFTDGTSRGRSHREGRSSEIAVILGAGNFSVLSVTDVLYHMFVEGRVCVLKHHPLQLASKPFIDHLFLPLIRRGFLISVNADLQMTKALINSDRVDCVHLTGGVHTYDAIVFGTEDQAANKAQKKTLLRAKMLSELGAITPFIVMPSSNNQTPEWTDKAIRSHAMSTVTGFLLRCSCACNAAKVLILPADFPQLTDTFCSTFKHLLAKAKLEPAWYPGMKQRYDRWIKSHQANGSNIEIFSDAPRMRCGSLTEFLPAAVADAGTVRAEDLRNPAAPLFRDAAWTQEEPFAPVITIVRIPGATAEEYAANAFRFADERLWGNLSCAVFAPDSSLPLVMDYIANGTGLKYGAVAVNVPAYLSFNATGYWGGARGVNSVENVQSGIGNVCNMWMFDTPLRSVTLAPFAAPPQDKLSVPRWIAVPLVRFICAGLWSLFWPFSKYAMAT